MVERANIQLVTEIINLSEAGHWKEAKAEWYLYEIYHEEEPNTCLCGHFPILEICVLKNKKNQATVEVGNVCVKKFLGLPSEKIFAALRRITKDRRKAVNGEAIQHAHSKNWITDWERDFYLNTMRKRIMSENQWAKRLQINNKLFLKTRRTS